MEGQRSAARVVAGAGTDAPFLRRPHGRARLLYNIEVPAQPARQFDGCVDLVLRSIRFHGNTDLVINHWQSSWLERPVTAR